MRALVLILSLFATPTPAQQYDPEAPCGRDENGVAYPCTSVNPNRLEST